MNSMTCREFDEVVHGFVRMELLDVTLRESVTDHAARCDNCAERLTEAAILAEASETAGGNLREQQAPPSVETAVLAAFRSHHRRATWRRSFEWAAVGAIAATALVVFWSFSGRSSRGQSSSPAPKRDVTSQSKLPLDAKGPASSQPAEIVPVAETEDEATAATGATLASENFVPLPYADAIGPEDLGMVVRVQVTRASLAELGYPVADTPDPEEDLISADVLVGEDGWPRAVRLVQ